jgi:hypothetical protein
LPVDIRDTVRNASTKSRLPQCIDGYGSVDQFLAIEKSSDEQTDDELAYERRVFDALTHIMVQMSLMIDVPHVEGYPSVHLGR